MNIKTQYYIYRHNTLIMSVVLILLWQTEPQLFTLPVYYYWCDTNDQFS